MNICIFLDSPLHAPGGMVQSVLNQRLALQAAGHTVYLVCLGRGKAADVRTLFAKPYVCIINDHVNFAYLLNNPLATWQVHRFLKRHNIDVVHVQSDMSTANLGVKLARRMGIPVLSTVHNFFWPATGPLQTSGGFLLQAVYLLHSGHRLRLSTFGDNRLERAVRGMTETMCRQVDVVIAPSAHLKNKLQECGVTTDIEVIPNPYYAPAESEQAPTLLSNAHSPHFVWIGRCAPEKRLVEFVKAVALTATQTNQDFRVTIVGDGPDLVRAKALASKEGVAWLINFAGRVDNRKVTQYIDDASFTVLSSYHFDNQPVVIAESLSRFRGVLYCDERITEGVAEAGLRTASPDAAGFADSMVQIVADPAIAVRYSHLAKAAGEEFSYTQFTKRFEEAVRVARSRRVV
ncbi:TPA: hypothetical protein DEW05_04570 [Candidatus Saccharibacteria bacterium]|nr:hypothetical protein [Candidatus Saccharibacteria bacterium]